MVLLKSTNEKWKESLSYTHENRYTYFCISDVWLDFLRRLLCLIFLYFVWFTWPLCTACRIFVSGSGIKTMPPEVEAQSLNHWTPRKSRLSFIMVSPFYLECPPQTRCTTGPEDDLLRGSSCRWVDSISSSSLITQHIIYFTRVIIHLWHYAIL